MSYVAVKKLQAQENNLDDVTEMISWLSMFGLEDYKLITQSLCYKLEVWHLKDVGIYQAGRVKWRTSPSCIMAPIHL